MNFILPFDVSNIITRKTLLEYEDKNFFIPLADPIDAIKLKMKELGLKNKDFIGKVGSKSYVSMILKRKKPLTLDLARLFHKELNISADILLS